VNARYTRRGAAQHDCSDPEIRMKRLVADVAFLVLATSTQARLARSTFAGVNAESRG
jgi:hypothetical protein